MKIPKLQIGIFSLTSCEGCCFSVLDWPAEFLSLKEKVEIKNFRLFEEAEHFDNERFDVVFIEGSPLTEKDIKQIKTLRKNSKVVVAFGACAHIGGVYHLKQYQDKNKIFNHIYHNLTMRGVENNDVRPLNALIEVDFVLPGCPINAKEFFQFIYQFLIGKSPTLLNNPVCYECQIHGNECLLQKGEVCLGPITRAGCEAVCLKSKQGCWGCRGLIEDAETTNLLKKLREKFNDKEIIKHLEVFGIKEQI
jgi:coenzyme F420-reducing hydrogenase gamma subunit